MMFQDPIGSLSPRITIQSLITEPFKIQGLKDRDLAAEGKRLLEMVGLPAHFAGRYPFQLSGGQASGSTMSTPRRRTATAWAASVSA